MHMFLRPIPSNRRRRVMTCVSIVIGRVRSHRGRIAPVATSRQRRRMCQLNLRSGSRSSSVTMAAERSKTILPNAPPVISTLRSRPRCEVSSPTCRSRRALSVTIRMDCARILTMSWQPLIRTRTLFAAIATRRTLASMMLPRATTAWQNGHL